MGGGKSPCSLGRTFSSADYWDVRYKTDGNSGAGSYGRLASFKADVLNNFVEDNNVRSVIEFGVGDGNNLKLYHSFSYLGFDVSKTVLDSTAKIFKTDDTKRFLHTSKYKNQRADLSLSFDVIYHLIEDEVFDQYMYNLFSSADKYVIIYSSNKDQDHVLHVKHRKFTNWIDQNCKNWKLKRFIKNKYPFDDKNLNETSFSDFYIFEKVSI